jgi:Golgi SNAP receptor complex protein 2
VHEYSRKENDFGVTRIHDNLQQLKADCHRLENMVQKEPPHRRQDAKIMVEQFVADCQALDHALSVHQQRKEAHAQALREREELLSRRFVPNSAIGDTTIQVDHHLAENDRLRGVHQGVDSLLDNAGSILSSLQEQKGILKTVQRKFLDIMSTLGLSNTVMRLIERRTAQDKWIFWGGVIVTIVIMFLVVYTFR